MRRILFSAIALTLMSTLSGCWHTAGICDCRDDDYCRTGASSSSSGCSNCGNNGAVTLPVVTSNPGRL